MMDNLPLPFVLRMQQSLGAEWPLFQESLKQPSPVSVRNHFFKEKKWKEISGKVKWSSNGVYLPERPIFTLDPAFHAGAYYVQEASSMLLEQAVCQTIDLGRPLRVLDLAAAPGGKSTLLAELINSDSLLVANEVIRNRYQVLRYNLSKWGYAHTMSSNHDTRDFDGLSSWFDLVLLDAPCSGEGLFRKDPGAVEEWSEDAVQLCAARQRRIVADAVRLVRPGGVLLYSTCTYNEAENGANVRWIQSEFDFEPITLHLLSDWGIEAMNPGYQCFPHRVPGEGFYLAALRKKGTIGIPDRHKATSIAGWGTLSAKQAAMVQPWLRDPDSFLLLGDEQQSVRAIPHALAPWISTVATKLRRTDWGIEVGTIKGKDFIPSAELALSLHVSTSIPSVDLDCQTALHFLKKEAIAIPASISGGWVLARYEGLNLGWMKVLKDRINNYYPKNWRILMDIP